MTFKADQVTRWIQEVRVAFPILWCPSEADLYPLGTSHQFPQTALARRTKSQLKTTD